MTIGLTRRPFLLEPLRQVYAAAFAAELQSRYDLLNLLWRNQRPPVAWLTELPTWFALALAPEPSHVRCFEGAVGRRRLG